MSIRKYGRYWALYDAGELVCVCLYRKGLPRSSGGCSGPAPPAPPTQTRHKPAYASRADAWGSSDAASALP